MPVPAEQDILVGGQAPPTLPMEKLPQPSQASPLPAERMAEVAKPEFATPAVEATPALESPRVAAVEMPAAKQAQSAAAKIAAAEPARPAAVEIAAAEPAQSAVADTSATQDVEAKRQNPQVWLEEIEKLRRDGKIKEARESLAEFRKRYPNHELPKTLRNL
jgi:hypothetical protein